MSFLHTARVAPEKQSHRLPAAVLFCGGQGDDMTKRIGAIETVYAGHKFRSRLEARWAVFFDKLNIRWQYEPQGFEADGQRYLPDFFLPDAGIWAEVKGDPDGILEDRKKLIAVLKADGLMPSVDEVQADGWTSSRGLLILSEIPSYVVGLTFHPLYVRCPDGSIARDWGVFFTNSSRATPGVWPAGKGLLQMFCGLHYFPKADESDKWEAWCATSMRVECHHTNTDVNAAYEAARMARFEHGQSGA